MCVAWWGNGNGFRLAIVPSLSLNNSGHVAHVATCASVTKQLYRSKGGDAPQLAAVSLAMCVTDSVETHWPQSRRLYALRKCGALLSFAFLCVGLRPQSQLTSYRPILTEVTVTYFTLVWLTNKQLIWVRPCLTRKKLQHYTSVVYSYCCYGSNFGRYCGYCWCSWYSRWAATACYSSCCTRITRWRNQ